MDYQYGLWTIDDDNDDSYSSSYKSYYKVLNCTQMISSNPLSSILNYRIFSQMSDPNMMNAIRAANLSSSLLTHQESTQHRKHSNLSQKQQMRINAQRYHLGHKLSKQSSNHELIYKDVNYIVEIQGLNLNTQAFLVTIEMLGQEQQVRFWKDQVLSGRVIGSYGQTQLGHGSNVQMLETKAVYNDQTKTFVIDSPTTTSHKFWPGALGIYCTHSVVQARTFVKGKSIGVQTFVVPVRNQRLEDLEGVESGDIGPKLGFLRVDNGYLKFNNVEIPLNSMLSKYIKVNPDGSVEGLDNKQAVKYGYGSMLNLRVRLTNSFALQHIYFPSIAVNMIYREMGIEKEKEAEVMERVCTAFGFIIANFHTLNIFKRFQQEIKNQNYEAADKYLVKCHIISSTIKALASWEAIRSSKEILIINKYSRFNSTILPKAFVDVVPSATYEGDNSVLLQQTARYVLMKEQGDELTRPSSSARIDQPEQILEIMKYVTSMQIRKLKSQFEKEDEKGVNFDTVWNEKYQREILEVSKLWGVTTLINGFLISLKAETQFKELFTKIGSFFLQGLVKQVNQLAFYGFEISLGTRSVFTEEEIAGLLEMNRPVPREFEPMKLYAREGPWISAKL